MTSPRRLAYFTHGSCSSRMCVGCCLQMEGQLWAELFTDWPESAMWDATGFYELPPLAPAINANGSSSLPTPTARDHKTGVDHRGRTEGPDLFGALTLLPTPTAGQHNYDEDPDQWLARRETLKAKGINGNGAGTPLGVAVKMLPTPESSDATGGRRSAELGGMRPSGAKRAITLGTALHHSASTSPPSTDGPTSSDDPPPQDSTADDSTPASFSGCRDFPKAG